MEVRQPRKLAVILHADVVGSTALVQRDESLAHERIQDAFHRFSRTIESYNGHPLELRGDALVAEFNRASDAVEASLTFQVENTRFNSTLDDNIQPTLRVGISLGEVVVADNTITGEGIVLAQRLEQLASGGGVCIQGAVYEAVPGRLPFDYESLGEQALKGISEPVRAYAVSLKPGESIPAPEVFAVRGEAQPERPKRRWIVIGATAFLVLVGVGLAWFQPWVAREKPASIERMAFSLPDKPSIAVLPFTNMSGDPEQEYFTDGITEDLTTDLSKISGLFVIARNSAFSYKGRQVKVRQVAEQLGVRYVLEGSVRRAGGRVRINAQLIDAVTAGHVWADRYDGDSTDVFALQDQVVRSIVSSLEVTLSDKEQAQLARTPTNNMEAYDFYLRGRRRLWARSVQGRRDALMHFQKAIALDREFADAYAGVARVASEVWRSSGESTVLLPKAVARKLAYQASGKALAIDPKNAQAYSVLAYQQVADGHHDEALRSVETAISLQPGNAEIHTDLANILVYAGRPKEALAAMEAAFRLEPNRPPSFYADLGSALFADHQYQKAVESLEKALEGGIERFEPLAKTYARLGRQEEARAVVDKLLAVFPGASLAEYRADEGRHYKRQEDLNHSIDSLRKAGLPEWPFGYEARAVDRLDGAAIGALVFGQTWTGEDIVNGGPFIQETSEDGKLAFRSGYSLVTGKAWVENDQLCLHFPSYGELHRYCTYLFRNPGGSREQQNEYVLVGETQILHFSTESP